MGARMYHCEHKRNYYVNCDENSPECGTLLELDRIPSYR